MEATAHLPANRSPIGWAVRRFWLCAACLVLAAFATRMAAAVWWHGRLDSRTRFAFADSETYWALAGTIHRGEPYQYGSPDAAVFRTPGYPALLAIVFGLSGSDHPPIRFALGLSALCGAAATAAVITLGTRWHSPTVGLIAGVLAAFHPEAIALGSFVLSEAPFHPLMVMNVWCFHEALTRLDQGRKNGLLVAAFAAGVTAGLAALMRPSWLLFPPFILGWKLAFDLLSRRIRMRPSTAVAGVVSAPATDEPLCYLSESRSTARWGHAIRCAFVEFARLAPPVVLGLSLTMAPWWWRNYRVVGEFVPTTLQVGASLYDGLRPDAEGGSDMRFAPRFFDELKREDAAQFTAQSTTKSTTKSTAQSTKEPAKEESAAKSTAGGGTFESRLDRRQRDAAVAWARANPVRVLELAGIKFARMWSPVPNSRDMGGALIRVVIAIGFVPLMLFAAWQTWRCRGRWQAVWLLWAPAIYLTCLHTIFVSSLRYRQPALLPLMVLAAAALAEGAARWLPSFGRKPDA
jgi:hypothetical protein